MNILYCESCGKSMTDKKGASFIGISILVTARKGQKTFIQKQLGKFKIGKSYNVCFECWLKSLGVK